MPVAPILAPGRPRTWGVSDADLDKRVQLISGRTGRLMQFISQDVLSGDTTETRRMAMVSWDDHQRDAQLEDPARLQVIG